MKKLVFTIITTVLVAVGVHTSTIKLADQSKELEKIDLSQYGIVLNDSKHDNDLEILAAHYSEKELRKVNSLNKDKKTVKESKRKEKENLESKPNVAYETVESTTTIPYETIRKENADLEKGVIQVIQSGYEGEYKVVEKYEVVNGNKTLIATDTFVINDVVNEVIEVGTKEAMIARGYYDEGTAYETLSYVNELRSQAGVSPLSWSTSHEQAGNIRAQEISVSFSHTRPNGSAWYTIDDRIMAENIAYGQRSAASVVESFNNSAVHRENMLSGKWQYMSVSLYVVDGVYYWVQLFS